MDQKIRLRRTGNVPLTFNGRLVTEGQTGGRDLTRWFELKLYRTTSGRLVMAVDYQSRWEGDTNRHAALVIDPSEPNACYGSLQEAIQAFNPEACPKPYPAGTANLPKQQRLERDVRDAYESAVADMIEKLEGPEADAMVETIE